MAFATTNGFSDELIWDSVPKLDHEKPVPTAPELVPLPPKVQETKNGSFSHKKPKVKKSDRSVTECDFENGNLPKELMAFCKVQSVTDSIYSVTSKTQVGQKLANLRRGDEIVASIWQVVVASSTLPSPVTAIIKSGAYSGAKLHGQAKMDPSSKKVLLTFEHLMIPGTKATYKLSASGHQMNGEIGLSGDHHSGELAAVLTSTLTNFSSVLLDSGVERNTTILGNQVAEQSMGNRLKLSGAASLAKEGERQTEKARSAPEYTEIKGGQDIIVIFNSDVIEEI